MYRQWRGFTCAIAILFHVAVAFSLVDAADGQEGRPNTVGEPVVIELFYRSDSENSNAALKWLTELQRRRQGLRVLAHDVLADTEQLKRVWALSKRYGYEQAQVPTFYLCNNLRVGFDSGETGGRRVEKLLEIRAYVRSGCQHCAAAKRFIDSLVQVRPALKVQYFDVVQSAQARIEMQEVARRYKTQVPSLPCIEVAGRLIVGYQTDAITGAKIESYFRHPVGLQQNENESNADRHGNVDQNDLKSNTEVRDDSPTISSRQWSSGRPHRRSYEALALLYRTLASSEWMFIGPMDMAGADQVGDQTEDQESFADDLSRRESGRQEESLALPADDVPPLPLDIPLPVDPGDAQDLPPPAEGLEQVPYLLDSELMDEVEVPWLGTLSVSQLGLPLFTFLIGLIDGFNPCAMWVLIFLLSVLVNLKDRRKILLVAGTFVVISGLAYFAFMAAWFNVFQLIGLLRPVQVGLGLLGVTIGLVNIKDYFAFHKGVTFSIPESSKPGIYKRVRKIVQAEHLWTALIGAIVLAVIVNIVELLCTAGLPAMYTAILKLQDLPAWANYAYLGLYIVAYMFDDTVLVAIVVTTLSHRRLQESEGRWLKLLSGVVILVIALILLFKPAWLS